MSRPPLQYTLASNTFFLDHGESHIPSNQPPTAKVLNIGVGDTYPVLATTSGNILDIRSKFSHTAGDARGIYNSMLLEGSAGGESLRTITYVNSNVDTARGAHISLDFEATAGGSECSGLGTALDCTLMIPDIASWEPSGTYTALKVGIYSWGTASDPQGMTELSFINISNDGHADGRADVDTDAFLLSLQGFTAGANDLFATGLTAATVNAATTASLKIRIGAVTYYIPIATAIT